MLRVFRQAFILYFIVWVVFIGCLPTEGNAMRIPTEATITESGVTVRNADLQRIQTKLESKLVAQRLRDVGLTTAEVHQRLANLTDEQLHKVAQNLDGLQPGGGILILLLAIIGAVVVVMAIIGLAKDV